MPPTTELPPKSSAPQVQPRANQAERDPNPKSDKTVYARYQFRVMAGSIACADLEEPAPIHDDGTPNYRGKRPTKLFRTGEVFWTNSDMKVHNYPQSEKFRLVKDHGPDHDTTPEAVKKAQTHNARFMPKLDAEREAKLKRQRLEAMDIGELRSLAADNEFDLGKAKDKKEIIDKIMEETKLYPTESL